MSPITRNTTSAISLIAILFGSTPAKADWWSKNVAPIGHAVEKGAHDVGKTTEKAAQDTGKTLEKAAQDTGKTLEKAAQDTGSTINKANNDFHAQSRRDWDHVNQFLDGVAAEFCSIMTGGGSDRGDAGCNVNGGVGASTDGQTTTPYVYDPAQPDEHYAIGERELTVPSPSELATMDRLFGKAPEMQEWERREDQRLQLFLNPGDRLGLPWANAASETRYPNGTGEIRQSGGNFLDRRHDDRYPGGYRLHGGIDYLNNVGDAVFAPVTGTITRVVFPGEPGLKGIEIRTDRGYTAQVLYLSPTPEIAAALERGEHPAINAGRIIGMAQDLHMPVDDHGKTRPAYPLNVPQHVHVTLRDAEHRFVSPDGRTVIVMRKGEAPIVESKADN